MSADVYGVHPVFSRWQSGWYGGHIVSNEYWANLFKRDPMGSTLVTCIEIVFGGAKTLRVANGICSVSSNNNSGPIGYLPVLAEAPEVASTVTLGTSGSSARSYSVTLPNELVDAAGLIKNGILLAGFAELSLNFNNGEYENRMVLMRGEMDSGVAFYPTDGGTIEFSISDPKESADISIPPYVISEERFDGLAIGANAMGRRFPMVLNEWPNVPCSFTHENAAVIGFGYGMKPSTTEIIVDGESYDSNDMTYKFEIVSAADLMGTPCQFVRFKKPEKLTEDRTESIYISVTGAEGGNSPVQQAEYLCRGYSVLGTAGINLPHFGRASSKAGALSSRVCINASGDGNVSTLAFIEGELFGNFPMLGMVWDRGGYGPVYIDRTMEASVSLNADQYPVLDRVSAVSESSKTEVQNSFTVKYGYDPMLDAFSGVVERNPLNSSLCQVSMQQCGSRPLDALECVYVYDRFTANTIIDWYVNHRSLPHYTVEYACSTEIMVTLSLGDNILLTDDEFDWIDIKATVVGTVYKENRCVLTLIVWRPYYQQGTPMSSVQSSSRGIGNRGTWPTLTSNTASE